MVTLSSSSNHASQPEPTRRVYLDLDGVMADFDAHFPATFGVDHRGLADDAMWETINAHPSYFRDMPPCAGAVKFFRSIEHLRPIILTACPKTNYPHVARQKRAWVREHLSEHVTVLPVMGGRHKPLFMQEPGDILIDDWRKNIEAWNEAEGVGILHRSFEGTAAALRTALAATNAVQPQAVGVTGEAGWRPISEADCEVATIQTFGEVVLKNSHPAWVRDEDGRTYEAVWTVDDRKRSHRTDRELNYWWDIEAESPASPVEIYPHPLSEPPATRPAASGDGGGADGAVDLADLNRMFANIPAGPYSADARGGGWEVRAIDTDPTNKHHWPYRLCASIPGQQAGCDPDVFGFIAGVINAWPQIATTRPATLKGEVEKAQEAFSWAKKRVAEAQALQAQIDRLTKERDEARAQFDAHDELLHQCLDDRDAYRQRAIKGEAERDEATHTLDFVEKHLTARLEAAEAALASMTAERDRAREAIGDLVNIVEGIGVLDHGVWRDRDGSRLKDTKAWVSLYVLHADMRRSTPLSTPNADRAGDAGEAR